MNTSPIARAANAIPRKQKKSPHKVALPLDAYGMTAAHQVKNGWFNGTTES